MMGVVELGNNAPALWGKLVLVVMVVLLAAFGVRFHARQKPGGIGGPISRAKAFWLSFAIYFWFVVCAVFATDLALPPALAMVYGAMALSMWLRGVAELVMLYVTHNWRPPMGIAHDGFTIGLVLCVGGVALGTSEVSSWSNLALGGAALLMVLLVSLVLEIVHAWSFFVLVGKRTIGEEGIWFADDEDPRFAAINRRTRIGNVVLGVPVFGYVLWWIVS